MAPEGKKQRTMFGFDEPVEIGSLDLDELLKNLPEEKCKDFGKDLAPKRSEARDENDPEHLEAEKVFAALPPPKPHQAQMGWSRDWERVWEDHDQNIRSLALDDELIDDGKEPKTCIEPFKIKEIVNPKGFKLQVFDLSGGYTVCLAKQRMKDEQDIHSISRIKYAREKRQAELNALLPDVTRIPDYPTATLKTHRGDETIPLIGLGTWKSEPGKVKDAVVTALKSGYLHVDCASVYENEGEVGDAFQEVFESTKLNREEVFVTSKLWNTDHEPDKVEAALKKSLELLKLEYLDLYLMHWPVTGNKGSAVVTPSILDTWKAMEDLVRRGFVKAIGVSNFSEKKIRDLLGHATVPMSVCQVECHPYWPQHELQRFCTSNGIHLTAYSPLGSPDSAAMFNRNTPELMKDPAVIGVSARTGRNVGQCLVKWALQPRPACSVLPKSSSPGRIRGNLDVLTWRLSDNDLDAIDAVAHRCRMVDGSFWLSKDGPYVTLEDLWDGP